MRGLSVSVLAAMAVFTIAAMAFSSEHAYDTGSLIIDGCISCVVGQTAAKVSVIDGGVISTDNI